MKQLEVWHPFAISVFFFQVLFMCRSETPGLKPRLTYPQFPPDARKLFHLESELAANLSSALPNSISCPILSSYLVRYGTAQPQLDRYGDAKAEAVSGNPLLLYKLLDRLVELLTNLNDPQHQTDCQLHNKPQFDMTLLAAKFTQMNIPLPEETDLRDSVLGILRIHYVYGYNATLLRRGILGNIETGAELNFYESLKIVQKAMEWKLKVLAYQWLVSAQEVAKAPETKEILSQAWMKFANQARVKSIPDLHKKFAGQRQLVYPANPVTWNSAPQPKNFAKYATCRGELSSEFMQMEHKLFCEYRRTGYWYNDIGPAKAEMLSKSPELWQYVDFLGPRAMAYLRKFGSLDNYSVEFTNFRPPDLHDFTNGVDFYTTKELLEKEHHERLLGVMEQLDAKIDAATGLRVNRDVGNQTAFLMYGAGCHYDIHHDSWQIGPDYDASKGDRLGNILIFLRNTALGGNLGFPVIGVHVKPVPGNMIVWHNILRGGAPDARMFHLGCPVVLGEKLILHAHFRQVENMWTFPCALKQEADDKFAAESLNRALPGVLTG